jgi:phage N-6-adenine-methyltransferase
VTRTSEWATPQWLADQLAAEFGGAFDLDVAATAENTKAPRYFTAAEDGLSQPWHAQRAWCNPPYGYKAQGRHVGAWMGKAAAEVSAGHAGIVVALVRASVDAGWWRAAVRDAALVRIWPSRIEFLGMRWRVAPFPSAILVFGALQGQHGTEPAWCAGCGRVFWPARSHARTCSDRCRQAVSRAARR